MTGGYKIIDLGYTNFTTAKAVSVPGIAVHGARKSQFPEPVSHLIYTGKRSQ